MRTSSLSHLSIPLRYFAGVRVYPFEDGFGASCDAENSSSKLFRRSLQLVVSGLSPMSSVQAFSAQPQLASPRLSLCPRSFAPSLPLHRFSHLPVPARPSQTLKPQRRALGVPLPVTNPDLVILSFLSPRRCVVPARSVSPQRKVLSINPSRPTGLVSTRKTCLNILDL